MKICGRFMAQFHVSAGQAMRPRDVQFVFFGHNYNDVYFQADIITHS